KNAGAAHKGSFSRLKHTYAAMAGGSKGNSFREMKARLPSSAHSIYYVDQIGNVSTSDVRKTTGDTLLTLNTRYPLQGGWKVDFKI
ncbi:Ribophorin I, partial [Dunaliella salina]